MQWEQNATYDQEQQVTTGAGATAMAPNAGQSSEPIREVWIHAEGFAAASA
jgi:hypothetical protein